MRCLKRLQSATNELMPYSTLEIDESALDQLPVEGNVQDELAEITLNDILLEAFNKEASVGVNVDTLDSAFDHTFCFNTPNLGSTDDQIKRVISLDAPKFEPNPVNEPDPFFSSRTYPYLLPVCEGDWSNPAFNHGE